MAKKSCSSFNCPQDSNPDIPVRVPEHKLLQDTSGHHWCHACIKRYKLMNWAKVNEWPDVRVQSRTHYGYYSILGEESEWFMSVFLGNEDMIDALYAGLVEIPDIEDA